MNGNDYLEIEEEYREKIFYDWVKTIDIDDVPQEYINKWIDRHLEGN